MRHLVELPVMKISSDTVVMMSNFVVLNFFYWNYRMTIYIYSLYITYRNNQEWVSCLCMFYTFDRCLDTW